jgi:hypothetical protein
MSKLHFKLDFGSSELISLDLPIEVRKSNLALVAQSTTSQSVELEPGTYFITTRLPAGQELSNQIKMRKGKDETVTLTPELEDRSPHEWLEVQHYLGSLPTNLYQSSELEVLGPGDEVDARLRGFRGNLLQDALENADPWEMPSSSDEVVKLRIRGANQVQLVQLLQPITPPINMALPVSIMNGCQLIIARLANGTCSIDVDLENTAAEALLRYYESGQLSKVSALTNTSSTTQISESLLYGKDTDPIAASVGAYTLLRLGELERLHTWTENLKDLFTWLPDGVVIRAEHLARVGEHDQALTVLLDLPSRGLPFFSDGLSYALDRLRLYISVGRSKVTLANMPQAQVLLEQLQRFATFVDFHKPILTFTGLDPRNPDDKPLGEGIVSYGGLELSQYLI